MPEIKCPNCGKLIKLDKSSYDTLLNEVEKEEINKRVSEQTKQIEDKYKAQLELESNKIKNKQDITISELEKSIAVLKEKLSNTDNEIQIAVAKALEKSNSELNLKQQEIIKLQNEVESTKKDSQINEKRLKENFDFQLKAKEDEVKHWKEFRMGDSTKDLGESLEKYCQDEFSSIRSFAYPRAYFEKDNEVDEEGKGDFIFKDYSEDGTELVSIMFEMKNQKDNTDKANKHKNEDFFKKLDKNRTSKGCEYAVLVSTLEEDSKLYNSGIVDVSYRYPKMFVVRPQNFLAIIGLLKNMAINNLKYKQQVIAYRKENIDVTNFEAAVKAVAEKITNDYEKADKIYSEVDKMCDDIVKKVENFRKEFKTATGWIEKAKNQLPNLEVRKLTKGNPTMKEKFDNLDKEGE